jgi:hypothetical protein
MKIGVIENVGNRFARRITPPTRRQAEFTCLRRASRDETLDRGMGTEEWDEFEKQTQ